MRTKSSYSRPEAELLFVRFEEGFLQYSPFNEDGNQKLLFDEEDEEFM